MSETGITKKILKDTIARFESADAGNTAVAKLLREGVSEGKLQNSDWIVEILMNTEDSTVAEEPPNETTEP